MARRLKKPPEGKKLAERPEDKAWKDWFGKLKKEDHEKYLSQLGLDDEDIDDFEVDMGFKEEGEEKPKKKKK